ncbi:MAG: STAS domain-containing protein [Holosporaceae bacterium]|jgi:SulP family sulfate permease|nr:STAS domain-containing protein [Holosporaceae bacterium]
MEKSSRNGRDEWTPEIILSLRENYSLSSFLSDARAGILVSTVAFPLFMTFAIASGVPPAVGIITCVIAGTLACLFGGAKFQIVGPTGAFAMIVGDIIGKYGFEGMTCALLMAGIMMIFFGLTKTGDIIRYIPYPVTAGFTAGIGLSIIAAQLNNFLGIQSTVAPTDFVERLCSCVTDIGSMNFPSFGLALCSLIFLEVMQKYRPDMPRYFFVLAAGTIFSLIFNDGGMATVGSRFGDVSCRLPDFSIPSAVFSFSNLKKLFPSAFAVAFLGSIESLLGAVISDNLSGQKHNSNTELIGQGIANLGSAFFGGIPATCALGTTSLNVKAGARTPVAGLINVLCLLLFVLCLGDFVKVIPMSSLSAMLLSAAWNMASLKKNKYILSAPKSDSFVFIATTSVTLLADIVVAVEIGLALSAFLFVKRSVETAATETFSQTIIGENNVEVECECVKIHGHLFFGAVPILQNALKALPKTGDIVYIDMRDVPFVDVTGVKVLREFVIETKGRNIQVIIGGLNKRTLKVLKKTDINNDLEGHLFEDPLDEESGQRVLSTVRKFPQNVANAIFTAFTLLQH